MRGVGKDLIIRSELCFPPCLCNPSPKDGGKVFALAILKRRFQSELKQTQINYSKDFHIRARATPNHI